MLTCDTVNSLSGAYALDLLPPAEADAVAVHVASCVACGERTRSRQQTGEWLAHLVTPAPLPDGLRQRLQMRLQDLGRTRSRITTPLPPLQTVTVSPPRRRTHWLFWGVMGLLAISAVWNLLLWGETQVLQEARREADEERLRLTAQLQRAATLKPADLPPATARVSRLQGARHHASATGTLAYQPEAGRWQLTLQGLPVLPAGQVYQLWAGSGSRPAPIVAFRLNEAASPVPVPAHSALRPGMALLVTIEAGAGHDRPAGDLVLLGMVADSEQVGT